MSKSGYHNERRKPAEVLARKRGEDGNDLDQHATPLCLRTESGRTMNHEQTIQLLGYFMEEHPFSLRDRLEDTIREGNVPEVTRRALQLVRFVERLWIEAGRPPNLPPHRIYGGLDDYLDSAKP